MKSEQDDFDLMLDTALKSYLDRDPPSGMQRRILARLHPAPAVPRWLILSAAACAGLCLLWVSRSAPPRLVYSANMPPPSMAKPQRPAEGPMVGKVPVRRRRRTLPRLTPTQEALIRLVQTNPAVAIATLGEDRHDAIAPIEIAALTIDPLTIEELKTEEQTQ